MTAIPRVLLSFALLLPFCAQAGIYKYQDADGNWHFTDKPPANQRVETIEAEQDAPDNETPGASTQASDTAMDLAESLALKFQPANLVERATLATVSVKTQVGGGSGFFITENGYILTNRHVIRPTSGPEWVEIEKALREKQEAFREAQKILQGYSKALKADEAQLEAYSEAIQRESNSGARAAMTDRYRIAKAQHDARKREYDQVQETVTELERDYSQARSDYNIASSLTKLAQRFKIRLKDDQELTARLIKISKDHDLALLKLDGYKTPRIPRASGRASQGQKVFAIGSPLGMQDSVTSGVVTRYKDGLVYTDTQILPGNSGGPLVNENAEVIAVTTAKLTVSEVANQGFGVAIPIATALREFSSELGNQ